MRIYGNIKDNLGEPLMGVNIFSTENGKLTGEGGITDFDGNFDIELNSANDLTNVDISYLGFKSVSKDAKDLQGETIVLNESATRLDEVVLIGKAPVKKMDAMIKKYGLAVAGLGILSLALILVKVKNK